MLIFLLIVGVSANEFCYTDSPNLEDPSYTTPQVVTLELASGGVYQFAPDSFERLAIGSGVNLDSDRVIQIYEFTKEDSMATLTSHQDSVSVEVPKLDLTQPFELYIGETIELHQNGELLVEFISFLRMPFHIGWRDGTLCYEFEEKSEEPQESEEPHVSPISRTPLNTITPFHEL
jgi:hypothetical protein